MYFYIPSHAFASFTKPLVFFMLLTDSTTYISYSGVVEPPWQPLNWGLAAQGAVKNKAVVWLLLQMASLLDSARSERVFIPSCASHGENFC